MVGRFCRCGALVQDGQRCSCGYRRRKQYGPKNKQYDWAWDELSRRYRSEHPLCEECEQQGRVTPAASVHHLVKVKEAPHLKLKWSNLRALCWPCHARADAEQDAENRGGDFVVANCRQDHPLPTHTFFGPKAEGINR